MFIVFHIFFSLFPYISIFLLSSWIWVRHVFDHPETFHSNNVMSWFHNYLNCFSTSNSLNCLDTLKCKMIKAWNRSCNQDILVTIVEKYWYTKSALTLYSRLYVDAFYRIIPSAMFLIQNTFFGGAR